MTMVESWWGWGKWGFVEVVFLLVYLCTCVCVLICVWACFCWFICVCVFLSWFFLGVWGWWYVRIFVFFRKSIFLCRSETKRDDNQCWGTFAFCILQKHDTTLLTLMWHSANPGTAYVNSPEALFFGGEWGCGPLPVAVTTTIFPCLVGDLYKPSLATITEKRPHQRYSVYNHPIKQLAPFCRDHTYLR